MTSDLRWLPMASDLPPMAFDSIPHQVDIFVAEAAVPLMTS